MARARIERRGSRILQLRPPRATLRVRDPDGDRPIPRVAGLARGRTERRSPLCRDSARAAGFVSTVNASQALNLSVFEERFQAKLVADYPSTFPELPYCLTPCPDLHRDCADFIAAASRDRGARFTIPLKRHSDEFTTTHFACGFDDETIVARRQFRQDPTVARKNQIMCTRSSGRP